MSILCYEIRLALSRLWRRRVQSGLTLATFTISTSLALLGWSLFHTIYLENPEYDAQGEFQHVGLNGEVIKNGRMIGSTLDDVYGWQEQQTVFADFAPVVLYESIFVETNGGVERLLSANLSSAALRMTNAKPLMGRLFTPDEDKLGTTPVVMLSEKTWRNKYGADPHIIGKQIKVDSEPASVVGVMPESYRFPNEQEMWQPLGYSPFIKQTNVPRIDIVGRLKPGITPERAREDLQQILERRGENTIAARYKLQVAIEPLREYYLLEDMAQSSLTLFALALLFVLVGCANATNLVMIDFFGRTAETGSLLALGVPRSSAIRALFFQLFTLAMIAAVIGYAVLLAAGPSIHGAMARVVTPYWLLFSPQWHQVAMAAALALLSVGMAIIAPMIYLLMVNPEKIIQQGAGANRGTGRGLWRRGLMIGQIALLTVLAICAGLLYRSTSHLSEKHWGYDPSKIFRSKTAMKQVDFPTPQIRLEKHRALIDELERTPGIAVAGMMTRPTGFSGENSLKIARTADILEDGQSEGLAYFSSITPHIPAVHGATYIEGEPLAKDEALDGPVYAIINESLAKRLWPDQSAIGRTLFGRFDNPQAPVITGTIRGVVSDYQASGPKSDNNDFLFVSIKGGMHPASFLFARGDAALPTATMIRAAAERTDPRIIIYFAGSSAKTIATELSSIHLTTRLALVYALAALVLCAVGVYSITVTQILQRSREFGIRMALGIEPWELWKRFTAGHLITASIGVIAGVAIAFGVVRVLQTLLFGVSARDPLIFTSVALLILIVSALSCIPSFFRLKRINPADCLRSL